jgi:hypothetical protein
VTEEEGAPKKPARLFPSGPDWERYGRRTWCIVVAGQTHYSWQGPGGWVVEYDGRDDDNGGMCECPTQEEAHKWLREKILAHRDELNRVTGLKDA